MEHSYYDNQVNLATLVKGDPKAPFSIATTLRCRGGLFICLGFGTYQPLLVI